MTSRTLLIALALVVGSCGGGDGSPDAGGGVDAGDPLPSCEDDGDCNGGSFCSHMYCYFGTCAGGRLPCGDIALCNEEEDRCEEPPPPPEGLPIGVPEPCFGWGYETDAAPTIWVDNTDPDCDDAEGTAEAPLCDLFRGGRSVTYEAGDVVRVLGGPYLVSGDLELTMNGTEEAPVIVRGEGAARILFDGQGARVNFRWSGAYGIVEGLDFFHMTRHVVAGTELVLRDVAVHNPEDAFIDFNPVVSVTGSCVLIQDSEIFHNRRSNDTDSHGIQASEGSHHVWILDNEIWDNNGDAFQACHECFDAPPHHIYLGRNVLHEDRENGIDLKTIADVVISENLLYGYGDSATSNGDAMVIGSNGFDASMNQGPRRVLVVNNEIRDSANGIRVEGSEDVWVVGNVIHGVGRGFQVDDKPHGVIVLLHNTIADVTDGVGIYGCRPTVFRIANNVIAGVANRHLDLGDCGASALLLQGNLFWDPDGGLAARVDATPYLDVDALNGAAFAADNRFGDPLFEAPGFVPGAGSPAIDAAVEATDAFSQVVTTFGASIGRDRAGTTRPGDTPDIGAYERP